MNSEAMTEHDLLAAGRAALLAGDWPQARDQFVAALRVADLPEAHDGLGVALWWLNDIAAAHKERMQAYVGYKRQGALAPAALIAGWLAREQVFFRADVSAMSGWFARGARLASAAGPCAETAWFALLRASMCATPAEMEHMAMDALHHAEMFGDSDLEAMARAFYGLARVTLGHVADGMQALDEALTVALSGEVSSFSTIGEVYCVLLSACEIAGDLARLDSWLSAAIAFAQRHGSAYLSAYCRTTYGGLLITTGRWEDAEAELLAAMRAFQAGHDGLRVHAVAKLALLRVQEGRLEEAEALLAGYEDHPSAALPLARLYLAQGNTPLARAILEQHLSEDQPLEITQTPWLLFAVDVRLALDDGAGAQKSAERVTRLAQQCGSDLLLAQAALAQARVKRHNRESGAHQSLQSALRGLRAYDQAFVTGCVRLELARELCETDWPAAVTWARAALATFERIGATHDADVVRRLLRQLGAGPRPGPRVSGILTEREREVLRLLASGLTNRAIAERLCITPKTAEHHVSQILQKLGARNRVEAVTMAQLHGDL